jgi:hypothetical protein
MARVKNAPQKNADEDPRSSAAQIHSELAHLAPAW